MDKTSVCICKDSRDIAIFACRDRNIERHCRATCRKYYFCRIIAWAGNCFRHHVICNFHSEITGDLFSFGNKAERNGIGRNRRASHPDQTSDMLE